MISLLNYCILRHILTIYCLNKLVFSAINDIYRFFVLFFIHSVYFLWVFIFFLPFHPYVVIGYNDVSYLKLSIPFHYKIIDINVKFACARFVLSFPNIFIAIYGLINTLELIYCIKWANLVLHRGPVI